MPSASDAASGAALDGPPEASSPRRHTLGSDPRNEKPVHRRRRGLRSGAAAAAASCLPRSRTHSGLVHITSLYENVSGHYTMHVDAPGPEDSIKSSEWPMPRSASPVAAFLHSSAGGDDEDDDVDDHHEHHAGGDAGGGATVVPVALHVGAAHLLPHSAHPSIAVGLAVCALPCRYRLVRCRLLGAVHRPGGAAAGHWRTDRVAQPAPAAPASAPRLSVVRARRHDRHAVERLQFVRVPGVLAGGRRHRRLDRPQQQRAAHSLLVRGGAHRPGHGAVVDVGGESGGRRCGRVRVPGRRTHQHQLLAILRSVGTAGQLFRGDAGVLFRGALPTQGAVRAGADVRVLGRPGRGTVRGGDRCVGAAGGRRRLADGEHYTHSLKRLYRNTSRRRRLLAVHRRRRLRLILPDASFHLGPKVPDQSLHRPGGGIGQRADAVPLDVLAGLPQHVDLGHARLPALHTLHDAPQPAGALTTRCALAARLVLVKVGEAPDGRHHIGRLVHHDDGGGAQSAGHVAQCIEIHHHIVADPLGDERHRTAARDDRQQVVPAAAHPAGVPFNQRPQRDAHLLLHHARAVDVSADDEQLGAAVVLAAERGEPVRAATQDGGHHRHGLGVGDRARTAVQADIGRKGRFQARLALLALQ
eukprot:ctg_459.g152